MVAPADVEGLKELLATGTRILYEHGLVDAFGHLSVRLPGTDRFLINPRQSPALLRPTFGSSSAIWCTMKPIWATRASAKGSEIVQNARLRISFTRDSSAIAGGA